MASRFRTHAVGEAHQAAHMILTPHDHQRVPGVFEGVGRGVEFSAFVIPLFQQTVTADPVGLVLDDAQGSLPGKDGKIAPPA